jgi:hypothetical protein
MQKISRDGVNAYLWFDAYDSTNLDIETGGIPLYSGTGDDEPLPGCTVYISEQGNTPQPISPPAITWSNEMMKWKLLVPYESITQLTGGQIVIRKDGTIVPVTLDYEIDIFNSLVDGPYTLLDGLLLTFAFAAGDRVVSGQNKIFRSLGGTKNRISSVPNSSGMVVTKDVS